MSLSVSVSGRDTKYDSVRCSRISENRDYASARCSGIGQSQPAGQQFIPITDIVDSRVVDVSEIPDARFTKIERRTGGPPSTVGLCLIQAVYLLLTCLILPVIGLCTHGTLRRYRPWLL